MSNEGPNRRTLPNSKTVIVIPARMASTRLPGKPLADIHGAPMIVHVWRRAVESGLGRVIVACAEREISDAVGKAGGEAILTDPNHPSGTDRIFEALTKADPQGDYERVLNMQGDMPALDPKVIQTLAQIMDATPDPLATLVSEIKGAHERSNPNVVKAAIAWPDGDDRKPSRALYFSRTEIPHGEGLLYHHIGLYGWHREALARFVALPPSPLEKRERLEQLRALESGMTIAVARVETVPLGVDTPEDLERARAILKP